jgi:hypothetical protein
LRPRRAGHDDWCAAWRQRGWRPHNVHEYSADVGHRRQQRNCARGANCRARQ